MDIFIIYDRQEAVISDYFERFFKSCGIWVEKREYKEGQGVGRSNLCLTILQPEHLQGYQHAGGAGHVCLVTGDCGLDETSIVAWQEKGSPNKVVRNLFGGNSVINKLIALYEGNSFWKACWLYEELAQDDIKQWDEIISGICKDVLDSMEREHLQAFDDMHVQYFRFYCQYIKCGVVRTSIKRLEDSGQLLRDFMFWVKKYDNEAMFPHLAARICELNDIANKQSAYYYRKAVDCSNRSDFLYDTGHALEKILGDDEWGIKYYKKAYASEPRNYRALYKLAMAKELQRQWTEAFNLYSRIERQLLGIVESNYEHGNATSVKEIDYLYKAYKRLLYIYSRIFGCGGVVNAYTKKIDSIEEKLESRQSFKGLAEQMHSEELAKEIAQGLQKKFEGKCYR